MIEVGKINAVFNFGDVGFCSVGAVGKFVFISVITTVASFVLTWGLRAIPGVKRVL